MPLRFYFPEGESDIVALWGISAQDIYDISIKESGALLGHKVGSPNRSSAAR